MLLSRAHRFARTPRSTPTVTSSALLVLAALLSCLLLSVSPVTAVPVIQITSPTDQASVNWSDPRFSRHLESVFSLRATLSVISV